MYPRYNFDASWASPPCTQYSKARTRALTPRDLQVQINQYYKFLRSSYISTHQPSSLDNHWSGLLKHRPIMTHLPLPKKASYCKYVFSYQKHIAVWTDSDIEFEFCRNDCNCLIAMPESIIRKWRHQHIAQRGKAKNKNTEPFTQRTLQYSASTKSSHLPIHKR